MGEKLNNKLECPKCHTIYLTLTQDVEAENAYSLQFLRDISWHVDRA